MACTSLYQPSLYPLAPCLCSPAANLHDVITHKVLKEVKQAAAGLIRREGLENQTQVDGQV